MNQEYRIGEWYSFKYHESLSSMISCIISIENNQLIFLDSFGNSDIINRNIFTTLNPLFLGQGKKKWFGKGYRLSKAARIAQFWYINYILDYRLNLYSLKDYIRTINHDIPLSY